MFKSILSVAGGTLTYTPAVRGARAVMKRQQLRPSQSDEQVSLDVCKLRNSQSATEPPKQSEATFLKQ